MATNDRLTIIETTPEKRQVARVVTFAKDQVRYINWENIAATARDLGSHFDARFADAGDCTVTLFWTYEDEAEVPGTPD